MSRVLGVWGTISTGAGIALGLSLLASAPVIVTLGWATPAGFLISAVLLLPVVLSYLELAGSVPGSASPYSLIRSKGVTAPLFFIGWLLLGGSLSMSAFFAWALAERVDFFARGFLRVSVPEWSTVAVIVIVLFAYSVIASSGTSRSGGLQLTVTLIAVVASMVWLAMTPSTGEFQAEDLSPGRHWLTDVAILASTLWAVAAVINHRDQVRRPQRTIPVAVLSLWLGTALLSAVFVYLVLLHPGLTIEGGAVAGAVQIRHLQILNVVVGIIISATGASAALAGALRLQRRMALDGFLPGGESGSWKRRIGLQSLPVSPALVFVLAWLVPRQELVSVVSATVLLSSIALFVPYARKRRGEISSPDRLVLPLHPLFPGVAAAICGLLTLALPAWGLVGVAVWLAAGLGVYSLYAGSKSGAVRRSEVELSDADSEIDSTRGRLLLAVGADAERTAALVRFCSELAAADDKELLVLSVEPRHELLPMWELRMRAERSWRQLTRVVESSSVEGGATRAIVRIAPTEAAGVLEAAREYDTDLVLLGVNNLESESPVGGLELVEEVFRSTGRSLAVLSGDFDEPPRSLMVATSGGPHAGLALRIAASLSRESGEEIALVTVAAPGSEAESAARKVLDRTLDKAGIEEPTTARVLEGHDAVSSLVEGARDVDLLLIGSSADQVLKQTIAGGLAARIADRRGRPTLVAKRAEPQRRFWIRRLWNAISHPLPTLEPQERATVYSEMRFSARADVDYYVLISLASLIATCGLLLDSVAVIVGAMLVAPLMSPILAIAQGVVVGNDLLIRRASASTFKGMSVAVGLSVAFGLLLPDRVPTAQMLARGEPNVLDLLVAIAAGAAAAYGVCRSSVAAALPGVAIAVALVPPLCVAGWSLGAEEFTLAAGALLLFFTNLAGIVLVGAFVFLLLGFRPTRAKRNQVMRRSILLALLTFSIISVPLLLRTRYVLQAERLEAKIEDRLEQRESGAGKVEDIKVKRDDNGFLVELTLYLFRDPRSDDLQPVEEFRDELEELMGQPIRVRTTVVRATVFETEPSPEED